MTSLSPLQSACILLAFVFLVRPGSAATEFELIRDPRFRSGFILWEPTPGKHVRYGEWHVFDSKKEPVWGLSQWSSRFRLDPANALLSQNGGMILSNAAKSVILGSDADLRLGVNSEVEYGTRARKREDPWVHLLVEQEFIDPPFLDKLQSARFHLDARLSRSRNLHHGDYLPSLHAAQFQVFFTVHNRNRSTHGYGDLLWFGVPVYDSRYRQPAEFKSQDFGGTAKFIFTPSGNTFSAESAQDGKWITLERDLLPLMRDALQLAWAKGFLPDSRQPADYAIGGMNMGWELPGTFDVEMEVKNLSLSVATR